HTVAIIGRGLKENVHWQHEGRAVGGCDQGDRRRLVDDGESDGRRDGDAQAVVGGPGAQRGRAGRDVCPKDLKGWTGRVGGLAGRLSYFCAVSEEFDLAHEAIVVRCSGRERYGLAETDTGAIRGGGDRDGRWRVAGVGGS